MFFHFLEGELLLIKKPYKWTSFDVVSKIRIILKYRLGIKKIKVGHSGTLDPLASGLMLICTGKYTKRIEEFQNRDKVYTGTFCLGATTPSFDLETEPGNFRDFSAITSESVYATAHSFIGEQLQVPPVFSAIKIDGVRAYEMARSGEDFEIEPKSINIKRFEIKSVELPLVEFEIECSKGTYIRSIANDFGERLGCGAYLKNLYRTRIGEFSIDDAISIEQFEALVIQDKE